MNVRDHEYSRKITELSELLKDLAEKHSVPVDSLMVGMQGSSLFVWNYDAGRATNDHFNVLEWIDIVF